MADDAQQTGPQGEFPITVNAQYIKDLSFENPNAPNSLVNTGKAPDVDVNINVEAKKLSDTGYEVCLKINASAKTEESAAFVVELSYACIMTLNGVPDDQVQPVLMIEGPRLLFPFARQIVADATRDGGFPPLLINPIDFVAMYQQNAAATQDAAGTA